MSCSDRLIAKLTSQKQFNLKARICSWVATSNTDKLEVHEQSEFVNLAPTNEADEKGIYYRALSFATGDEGISNIALTGPYGSGKSSVIQTFLTKYQGTALQVSLAAFVPGDSSIVKNEVNDDSKYSTHVDRKDIERSILQQMLYGADANKLPLSRFNRIQSPTKSAHLLSLLSFIGISSTAYLLNKTDKLFNGELLTPFEISNWFNYLTVTISSLFLWFLVHKIYIQTFGISLKSVSLKNIELTSSSDDETSILNKHLDEIIYFFQSTDYDLVIFEDLDRFKNPSIFVTLREINSLINANAGVKRPVRFLYALRDDMFLNTERTKFFEFIIPVIPIINHSNSIDKILELVERKGFTGKLDTRFLGEVSRYLTDMRLIRSIFNEYEIYSSTLAGEDGSVHDSNKLLAILIYKNVLPHDFENLHKQAGVLAEILDQYDAYILKIESDHKEEIRTLKQDIVDISEQLPKGIVELNRIYAMALVELFPEGYSTLCIRHQVIQLKDLIASDDFEELVFSANITVRNRGNHQQAIDTSSLQEGDYSQATYSERKAKIERKSAKQQALIRERIKEIEIETLGVRKQKFHVTVQASKDEVSTILLKAGENSELLKYLIFEGYLDDTYYQYISLFHEGRMSPNDNKYLINIRAYKNPEAEFKIDNPSEVIRAMRNEDFSEKYILNHILLDFLVENSMMYSEQLALALKYISENFGVCTDFFSGYYSSGKNVEVFVTALADKWPGYAVEALEGNSGAEHIARILAYVPQNIILESLNKNQCVTEFLSVAAQQVFDHGLAIDPAKLTDLKVKIEDLSSIEKHTQLVGHIIDNSLYEITPDNISFVLSLGASHSKNDQLATSNLTTIFQSGHTALIQYVKRNYDTYFNSVFFFVETNTRESLETLHQILSDKEISVEIKKKIIASQKTVFPSFSEVPEELYGDILQCKTIEVSWKNLVQYRNYDGFDDDLLTQYLQDEEVQEALKAAPLPAEGEALELRRFVIGNDEFEDELYRKYIQLLPSNFTDFPSAVSHEKRLILIESKKVRLNADSFKSLENSKDLLAALIVNNIEEYLEKIESYSIDDDVRELLISSDISNESKYVVLRDLDTRYLVENHDLARNIANVLVDITFDAACHEFEFLKTVILNAESSDAQILLLNRCQVHLDNEQVSLIIERLPEPFSKIAKLGTSPKIPTNVENLAFADWLLSRDFISSMKVEGKQIRLHTYRKEKDL